MADLDAATREVLTAELAALEAEDQQRHVNMDYLRQRLGMGAGEVSGAPSQGLPTLVPMGTGTVVTVGGSSAVRPTEFFRMSIRQAVTRFLEIKKQPQAPKTMHDALKAGGLLTQSKNFYTTLWTQLKRMENDGELVNTPAGWALAVWYPSRPKAEEAKARPKNTKKPISAKKAEKMVPDKVPSPYREFLAEALKSGKTMAQAAADWKIKKGEA